MYLYGSFLTQLGETVTVHIVTENNRTKQIEIGDEKSGVFFTTNPVEIESSVNDTFDHLLRSQATIRLLTRDFIQDLFCTSCMDAVVNIFKGDKCIFAGFIEPQTYSQGYNEVYDELEITCIDALSALQYSKYRNIGVAGIEYADVRASAGQLTFKAIMAGILPKAICLTGPEANRESKMLYDGSKRLNKISAADTIFSQISISELLFLGESEDDVWTQEKVLESILKYLNLHIIQSGLRFYVFSWESIKDGDPIQWHNLTDGTTETATPSLVSIDLGLAASNDTTISIGEVYNQIMLTCKVDGIDTVIKSPLDNSDLISPYSGRQKYLTEYSSDVKTKNELKKMDAFTAFYNLVKGNDTEYDGASVTDWYIQVMNNPAWIFPEPGTGDSLIGKYCSDNRNQQILPNRMANTPAAALIAFGKHELRIDKKDNSPVSKIDMENYLVVSVNGNGNDTETGAYPTEESLLAASPCAVYAANTGGAVLSPADDETTNYLVVSGTLSLNPIMDFTRDFPTLFSTEWYGDKSVYDATVPTRTDDYGRFYTQKYYKADTPMSNATYDASTKRGLVPFTNTGVQEYEFTYSAIGDDTDTISKIGVLACMLIIGDKCLVETGTDGQISDFSWNPYRTREQCTSDDEYYAQSFTIGFNPKIGDKLIGTEFSVQNNIDFSMGLDTEGMAIPMRKSDKLSGAVKFMILGPVNALWDVVTRRHRTWFRRTKWGSSTIPLLAHVSSIFVKSLEMKIYSDNGLNMQSDNSDLIYMSDTNEAFINPKDDIEFDISSALTLAECQQLGVSNCIKLNTPLNADTGDSLLTIYDHVRKIQEKPEKLYVDSYYSECHKPRILMTQKIMDPNGGKADLFNRYVHPAMPDKIFYVQSLSRNLMEGYAELTIKEVWDD